MSDLMEDVKKLGTSVTKVHQLLEQAAAKGELKQCVWGMCTRDAIFADQSTPRQVFQICLVHLLTGPAWHDEKKRHVQAFLYSPPDVQQYVIDMLRKLASSNYSEDLATMREAAYSKGVEDESRINEACQSMRASWQNTLTVLEALTEE